MSDKEQEDRKCVKCGRLIYAVFPETQMCYLCAMTYLYYEGNNFDDE